MNILIITQRWYPDTFGGSEHVASEQALRLASRGHQVTVLTQRVRDTLPPVEEQGKMRIYRYGSERQFSRMAGKSRTDLEGVPRLIRHLDRAQRVERSHIVQGVGSLGAARDDQWGWDVAILHHPFAAAGFFRSGIKISALYVFHSSTAKEVEFEKTGRLPFLTPLFVAWASRIEKAALRRASRIGVFSDFSRGILLGMVPETHNRVVKLSSGIDQERFRPTDRATARGRLGLPKERTIFLSVRRFTPRMGLIRLIQAMEEVLREFPAVQLLIVGEGPLKQTLVAEIQRRDLQGKVTLVGSVPLEDLPLYYQSADLFVLPTEAYEGLGMSTLEALSCGIPVLGTQAGATPEILRDLDPTLMVSAASERALAQGMVAYLKRSSAEKEALAKGARALIEKKYNWERAVEELERVLEILIRPL